MQNTLTFKIHYNSSDYSDEFIISEVERNRSQSNRVHRSKHPLYG